MASTPDDGLLILWHEKQVRYLLTKGLRRIEREYLSDGGVMAKKKKPKGKPTKKTYP